MSLTAEEWIDALKYGFDESYEAYKQIGRHICFIIFDLRKPDKEDDYLFLTPDAFKNDPEAREMAANYDPEKEYVVVAAVCPENGNGDKYDYYRFIVPKPSA